MPLTHFLVVRYDVDFHKLVNSPQGKPEGSFLANLRFVSELIFVAEVAAAQAKMDEVQAAVEAAQQKAAEARQALNEARNKEAAAKVPSLFYSLHFCSRCACPSVS